MKNQSKEHWSLRKCSPYTLGFIFLVCIATFAIIAYMTKDNTVPETIDINIWHTKKSAQSVSSVSDELRMEN